MEKICYYNKTKYAFVVLWLYNFFRVDFNIENIMSSFLYLPMETDNL
jgi:hypothetical protein